MEKTAEPVRSTPMAQRFRGYLPVVVDVETGGFDWNRHALLELALQIADDATPQHDPRGDLLADVPVVSPFAWALAYQWPVHRIGPDFQPDLPPPEPTLLLVRRDASHQVRFAAISPLVYRLIELLGEGGHSGGDILRHLATEAGVDDVPAFVDQGAAMLVRMRDEGTLLGTAGAPFPIVGAT